MCTRFILPNTMEAFPLTYKISLAINLITIVTSSVDFSQSFSKLYTRDDNVCDVDGVESDRSR